MWCIILFYYNFVQVCEDDSLPKIICSHCVDKLESFYDFRESCVNAEAMLESYFTSLRFSDDFTREGKVIVAIMFLNFLLKIQKCKQL